MGDRGNIVIRQSAGTNSGDVWLYTHWGGTDIPEVVKRALAKKQRWDDKSYLARIIFQELVGDDKGGTGFDLSTRLQDNEHDLLVVDIPSQKVCVVDPNVEKDGKLPVDYKPKRGWTFEDYVALDELPEV